MVADTCTFCWDVLTKPTDRNLVEGKGNWSVELNDFPFVVLSISPYICKQCLTLVKKRKALKENLCQLNEQLTTLYQQKCAQRGLTFKRRHPQRLTFSATSYDDNNETLGHDDIFPVAPGTLLIDCVKEDDDSCQLKK